MSKVRYLSQAKRERDGLPALERKALYSAVRKLEALGKNLRYPHSSNVQGADRLRELRPRQGSSPWRALYRQYGDTFVIAAVCPEAEHDLRGFRKGCRDAAERLEDLEE